MSASQIARATEVSDRERARRLAIMAAAAMDADHKEKAQALATLALTFATLGQGKA